MTNAEILKAVANKTLSIEDAASLLNAPKGKELGCKVSAKGGLSVYGLQRMPVTLYVEQWERLIAFVDTIKAFIKANDKSLSRKADKQAA